MSSAKPNAKFKMTNYYEKVDDGDQIQRHYPNEELIQIKLPFRGLILGPSGSMKTNLALNLVSGIGIWDKVIILAKNLEEPLYKYTIKKIQAIEKSQKRRILLAIDDINDLPPIEMFDVKENTLMLVDDFVADAPKSLKPLEHIWLRGRKNGICPVFISQSYFDTPKMIRKNSNFVFIKQLGNVKDLARISAEYALGKTAKEIGALYERTLTGEQEDFFMIDRENKNKSLVFRDGFNAFE